MVVITKCKALRPDRRHVHAQVERKKSNRKGWRRAAKGIAVTSGLFAAAKDKQVGARSRTRPACCHRAFASDVVR